jgi:hypothetical protein
MEWVVELLAAALELFGTDRLWVAVAILICLVVASVALGYVALR